MSLLDKIKTSLGLTKDVEKVGPAIDHGELSPKAFGGQYAPVQNSIWDGEKFPGGLGPTQLLSMDYWTLRQRSAELFTSNLYAAGLIRRLVTNEINTGLSPEACPDELIIGVEEDSLNDWADMVENRFAVWCRDPLVCDWRQQMTFGALQRSARMEALISGDVLVVLRQSQRTKMPVVQLVSGSKVMTPLGDVGTLRKGNTIKYGVELDANQRHVAYWVKQDDGTSKRLPAYGEKSGRKLAWLVYGTQKRLDDVRGVPMLSLVLQSLKEIDRYRDSVQRKAVINSMLALFVKKTKDKMGTLPLTGGAVRKGALQVEDEGGQSRRFNIVDQIPGIAIEELQEGEEPVGFHNQGIDEKFGPFEQAIISTVAWANEVPPEILTLAFSNNYSASQAAINEFKIYLNKIWSEFGEEFCNPIYIDYLISDTLRGKVKAPGLLDAWRNTEEYDTFGAWVSVDWYGSIKPSTDMVKQAKGSKLLVDEGWSTNTREARITTGTKFSKNAKRLKRENELKVAMARPIAEFQKEFGKTPDRVIEDGAENVAN